jgi:hypothetical protein
MLFAVELSNQSEWLSTSTELRESSGKFSPFNLRVLPILAVAVSVIEAI